MSITINVWCISLGYESISSQSLQSWAISKLPWHYCWLKLQIRSHCTQLTLVLHTTHHCSAIIVVTITSLCFSEIHGSSLTRIMLKFTVYVICTELRTCFADRRVPVIFILLICLALLRKSLQTSISVFEYGLISNVPSRRPIFSKYHSLWYLSEKTRCNEWQVCFITLLKFWPQSWVLQRYDVCMKSEFIYGGGLLSRRRFEVIDTTNIVSIAERAVSPSGLLAVHEK